MRGSAGQKHAARAVLSRGGLAGEGVSVTASCGAPGDTRLHKKGSDLLFFFGAIQQLTSTVLRYCPLLAFTTQQCIVALHKADLCPPGRRSADPGLITAHHCSYSHDPTETP
ncbi:hypothetical protein EYF80_026131 [Liparis tanakae]|uniref:Uncharacterized protein n=1 Tax=Liparis tanakae TaxID=230148 RepID=A0A4Z2HE88_9TELE|nr:hypothetical protein EYF80_026131 [Liparis tanakae]